MSDNSYLRALETQLAWLRWLNSADGWRFTDKLEQYVVEHMDSRGFKGSHELIERVLAAEGGTYYVTAPFSEMVNQLAPTAPDTLGFKHEWLQSASGFLLMEKPFMRPWRFDPNEDDIRIKAIGWMPSLLAPQESIVILFYEANWLEEWVEFGIASIFKLRDGEKIGDVLLQVGRGESTPLQQADDNEPRLLYSLFYLLAQKLTAVSRREPNRAQRRRIERERPEFVPIIKVITLRRLEQQPLAKHQKQTVDWQYQWLVRWHWRNQYCPSTGEHKWTVIDTYVKGPLDKPLKPPGAKVFVAKR